MRRPLLFLLLCLPVVLGAISVSGNQPSDIESPSAFARLHPDAIEAKSAHAPTESSSSSDTADVHCPVKPTLGTATIRIDSTRQRWRLTVKPDSQLKEMARPPDWERVTLVSHGDLNQDGLRDLVVEYSYQGTQPVHPDRHGVFIGCGDDRYTPVTTDVSLEPDRLDRKLDVAKPWPDLTVLGAIKTNERTKDPNYYYHLTYRFDKEEGQYRPIPGSARYKKDSAQRLGIDLDDRPKCTVGKGPPIRIQPVEGTQRPLQSGDNVQIQPTHDLGNYKVEWTGDLNQDGLTDLILKENCSKEEGYCSYKGFYKCKNGSFQYSKILRNIYTGKINILSKTKDNKSWKKIEVKCHITGDREVLDFDGFGYKEGGKSYY